MKININKFLLMLLVSFLVSLEVHAEVEQTQYQFEKIDLNLELPNADKMPKAKSRVLGEDQAMMSGSHLGVFHNFWSNTGDSFTGNNFWYHGAAFGSTFVLAASGADRDVQDYFQEDPVGETYGVGALILGGIGQPVIGGALYFASDAETKTAGSAVLQTAIIQFAYTNVLKAATGRPDPIEDGDLANKQSGVCGNSSDATDFFQLVRGCTWPSGHASSAFSLVSSLYAFYPEKK